MTPHVGGAVGNVLTYGAAGATLRFGEDLRNDLGGPQRIRPSLPGSAYFDPVEQNLLLIGHLAQERAVPQEQRIDWADVEHLNSVFSVIHERLPGAIDTLLSAPGGLGHAYRVVASGAYLLQYQLDRCSGREPPP